MKKRFICLLLVVCVFFTVCSCNKENEAVLPNDDDIVYVSKSGGKIHRYKDCSGMKYYDEMTYADAILEGYAACEKCFG